MSEPFYAAVVWPDGSRPDVVRGPRAEADAWLQQEIERGGSDPNATVLIPESHRAANSG